MIALFSMYKLQHEFLKMVTSRTYYRGVASGGKKGDRVHRVGSLIFVTYTIIQGIISSEM